jgi:hypothetical protein
MSELQITIITDASAAQDDLEELNVNIENTERRLHDVQNVGNQTFRSLAGGAAAAMGVINSLVALFRGVVQLIGGTLDPIGEMILSIVTTIVSTLIAAASALAAGVVTAPMAVLVYGTALAFSIAGTVTAQLGIQEAQSQFAGVQSVFSQMTNAMF